MKAKKPLRPLTSASVKRGALAPHVQSAVNILRRNLPGDKLGGAIDAFYSARQARLELEREVHAIKERETSAKQQLIELLGAANLTGGKGTLASVTLSTSTVPHVDPTKWEQVFDWILKHDKHELLRKQLNSAAYRELLAEGESVPNVTSTSVIDLSIRAL